MGLLDKVKGILFDETEEDENVEELPKREPKKNKHKQSFIDYDKEEDTIKEVKVDYNTKEEKMNFPVDDFAPVTRTRSNISYDSFEEPKREIQEVKREIPEPVRHVEMERPSITQEIKRKEPETRSRYELPPKKEVVHEHRDYKKLLNDASNTEKKPFVVTPIISPVYGIIDKNYKPEEIVEKKPVQIDQVRERMFGPVSYNAEPIPEPVKYEESNETLTEKLIKENERIKASEEIEPISEFDEIVEEPTMEIDNSNIVEETHDERTSPSLDISDLINEVESTDYNTKDYEEDYFKDVKEEYAEEPTEEFQIEAEPRKAEVKEHLDDTIETDLFNLIDSMYKTDERE